ncbi:prolyl oligopeptidase family serine peptidase [Methylobacterium sp. J-048]|uniref:dienelactone hydrolase family protein n=1 Tax=Methylobacterium sp. J-048 TaxID=2836635 RepID=UPI001FB882B4|nr:CocE/NonD family hydrolase [Methylobacterium sp. J-048]MCJ2060540.1 prolyl oligopeptidase family serine peptidase [Methylobacterium sp. J-048]
MLSRIVYLIAILICSLSAQADTGNHSENGGLPPPAKRMILDLAGDPLRPVRLKVGLVLPPGPGPFPLVIWNHGSNRRDGSKDKRALVDETNIDRNMGVYYFLSRGYAVALPVMRGFGHSGGSIQATGCRLDDMGRNSAADIQAVLNQIGTRPEIDSRRVVVGGSSIGGWNSLAVGTLQDARVVAIVNFYGGIHSSACSNDNEALVQSTRRIAAISRVPSLWLYGDNDQVFPKPLWQAMHRGYVEQGGKAEMIAFGPYKSDSHHLLSDPYGVFIYSQSLDSFLERLGLPSQKKFPDYVPMSPPAPTHYSVIDDVESVPFLNASNRETYRKFLTSSHPRAFLIAPNKAVILNTGGFDPLAGGFAACERHGIECWPYAFNDDVVWAHPTPAPPPTQFAKLEDTTAIPYVNDAGRDAYKQFLTRSRPRAFVIAPDGRWSMSTGNPDPVAAALAACGDRGPPDCHAYAVDGAVVWSEAAAASH